MAIQSTKSKQGGKIMTCHCWWFGINNADKPKRNAHIIFKDIQKLFTGEIDEFEWPYHKNAKKCYELMRMNDKVLFWMGDGGPYKEWGILGTGFISEIRGGDTSCRSYILKMSFVPEQPLRPYPSKECQETEETNFLKEVFGVSFPPLGKTFNNLGYNTTRQVITIAEISIEQYEQVLKRLQGFSTQNPEPLLPEEIPESDSAIYEGAKQKITVNGYERDPKARRICIAHYGDSCTVCGFSFYKNYGEVGRGFIEVHHVTPLSKIGQNYQIDPIQDLRPVCPNCHAMLHRRNPPFSIEEIRQFLNK
ncbi:MAG: HNH endonuclease [candidate division KSB1 bacterium]|nr:HNH endonuclease [candidate division KSB1 bacterium]MDZ7399680.1 HNH endonuclease [candidate division KSB1 bacterium]